jgi:hypothetical protein
MKPVSWKYGEKTGPVVQPASAARVNVAKAWDLGSVIPAGMVSLDGKILELLGDEAYVSTSYAP